MGGDVGRQERLSLAAPAETQIRDAQSEENSRRTNETISQDFEASSRWFLELWLAGGFSPAAFQLADPLCDDTMSEVVITQQNGPNPAWRPLTVACQKSTAIEYFTKNPLGFRDLHSQSFALDMAAFLSPIPWASQLEFALNFWQSPECAETEGLQPFFQFYSDQCNMVYHAFRGRFPLQSHEDVKFIASRLRQGMSRSALRALLETRCPQTYQTEAVEGAIDLVVRLMTMLDVGRFPATSFSGRHSITWDRGTLREFLHELFPGTVRRNHDGTKIEASFNIRQLDRIGGLSVMLTTNLADHLLLLPEKDAVLVYHHATFLLNQDDALFPAGLVEETLNTLALLFPKGDVEVEKWYVRQGRDNIIDKAVLSCKARERDIGDFRHWHDRLVALLQRFEHPRQTTLKQAWFDRRNGAQWYSIWFAIGLTLLFGLVQSIEGAIQVYKAYQDA